MRKVKEVFDDLLLGGAAMSIDDLARVESQEIRWLLIGEDIENDNRNSLI